MWINWKKGQVISPSKNDELLKYLKKPSSSIIYGENAATVVWNLPPFGAVASQVAGINAKGELVFMEENIVQTLTVPYDSTSPNKERKFVVRARNNLGVGHWSDPIVVRLSKAEKSPEPQPVPPVIPKPATTIQKIYNIGFNWCDVLGAVLILFGLDQFYDKGYRMFGVVLMALGLLSLLACNAGQIVKWLKKVKAHASGLPFKNIVRATARIAAVVIAGLLLFWLATTLWSKRPWAGTGNLAAVPPPQVITAALKTNATVAVTLNTPNNNGVVIGVNNGTIDMDTAGSGRASTAHVQGIPTEAANEPKTGVIPLSSGWSRTIYLSTDGRSHIDWNVVEDNVPITVLANGNHEYVMRARNDPLFANLHLDGQLVSIAWAVPQGYRGEVSYTLH